MATTPPLKAELVKSLSTKFTNIGEVPQFQIALVYDGSSVLYKNYTDYTHYRQHHDELVKAINEEASIVDDFSRF